jgi:hypothetical protein
MAWSGTLQKAIQRRSAEQAHRSWDDKVEHRIDIDICCSFVTHHQVGLESLRAQHASRSVARVQLPYTGIATGGLFLNASRISNNLAMAPATRRGPWADFRLNSA